MSSIVSHSLNNFWNPLFKLFLLTHTYTICERGKEENGRSNRMLRMGNRETFLVWKKDSNRMNRRIYIYKSRKYASNVISNNDDCTMSNPTSIHVTHYLFFFLFSFIFVYPYFHFRCIPNDVLHVFFFFYSFFLCFLCSTACLNILILFDVCVCVKVSLHFMFYIYFGGFWMLFFLSSSFQWCS